MDFLCEHFMFFHCPLLENFILKNILAVLESVMCDVLAIRLKRRIATRSGKGNQLFNIKTAVERPILKLGLPNFRWSFYFILLLCASNHSEMPGLFLLGEHILNLPYLGRLSLAFTSFFYFSLPFLPYPFIHPYPPPFLIH